MASNLDYLNPALVPLEEKVDAYLEAEKALQRVLIAQKTQPQPNQAPHEPAANVAQLRQALAQLEADILALLPTRDEWVKVNLGYGPSRVGAWHVPATDAAPEHYKVRVIH